MSFVEGGKNVTLFTSWGEKKNLEIFDFNCRAKNIKRQSFWSSKIRLFGKKKVLFCHNIDITFVSHIQLKYVFF